MPAPDTKADGAWEELTVSDDAGERLDSWLAARAGPELSRSRVKNLIEMGSVRLNGAPAPAKSRLKPGDRVAWQVPEAEDATPAPENIPLQVVYEDADLIVLNKPAGLVVHPGAGNLTGTLVNALLYHCGDTLSGVGGVKRPGIVHRLDKETSGVMIVAKNDTAHRRLSEAFADHGRTGDLERTYLAVTWGAPERMTGRIDAAIGRSGHDRTKRAVVPEQRPGARHAVTHYRTLERFGMKDDATATAALLRCRLETGRTHQIRVHMAHIGHPLIGDPVYGQGLRTKANRLPHSQKAVVEAFWRQALHAATLAFRHPATGELLRFEAPMPDDMAGLVDSLREL